MLLIQLLLLLLLILSLHHYYYYYYNNNNNNNYYYYYQSSCPHYPLLRSNFTDTVLDRLQTPQVGKKFPVFYGSRIFITVFITFHNLFVLSQISPVCFFTNCFIVSPTPSFPNRLFPSGFPTKLVYAFLFFSTCATCPAYIILIHLITCTIFGDKYNLRNSFLYNFLQSSLSSGPSNFLSTLFSNTLRVGSCVYIRGQVSHPYKTTAKVVVLCSLMFLFVGSQLDEGRLQTECWLAFPRFRPTQLLLQCSFDLFLPLLAV